MKNQDILSRAAKRWNAMSAKNRKLLTHHDPRARFEKLSAVGKVDIVRSLFRKDLCAVLSEKEKTLHFLQRATSRNR